MILKQGLIAGVIADKTTEYSVKR